MEKVTILKQMAQFTRVIGKTIKDMGMEHSQMQRVISMLENGKMARLTVKVPILIRKRAVSMKVIGRMTSNTELDLKQDQKNQNMKVTSTTAKNTEMENKLGKKVAATKELGSTIRCKEKVRTHTQTVEPTKVNGSTTKCTAKESTHGLKVMSPRSTRENSKTTNNTAKENILGQTAE